MNPLVAYIAARRTAKGLTQRELARRLDISAAYYNDLEHGRRNLPGDDILEAVAVVLDEPAAPLFLLAGRMPPWLKVESIEQATTAWRALDSAFPDHEERIA